MADRTITVTIPASPEGTMRIRRVLDRPEPILKQIGILLLADAKRAFKDQRLGDIAWPPRYPRMSAPKINKAGVISDFLAGRTTPPERRFRDRPAGVDTNQTLRSLTYVKAVTAGGYVLTVRSSTPGARNLQEGASTTLPITQDVKTRMAAWMRRLRKSAKRKRAEGKEARESKLEAAKKMGYLFRRSVLRTRVARRPFFGITDASERTIMQIVTGAFLPGARGGEARDRA